MKKQKTKSDLIKRQDAIDAFRNRGDEIIPGGILRSTVYEVLENLPSAEPKTAENGSLDSDMPENKTDRTTGGMIYRQDAIDAVKRICWNCSNTICHNLINEMSVLPSRPAHGEWIPLRDDDGLNIGGGELVKFNGEQVYYCSECKVCKCKSSGGFMIPVVIKFPHCPFCGAEMKGE